MNSGTNHDNFLWIFELTGSISIVEKIVTEFVFFVFHLVIVGTDSKKMHWPPLYSSDCYLIFVIHIFQVFNLLLNSSQHFLAIFIAEGIAVGEVYLISFWENEIEVQLGVIFFCLSPLK